MHEDAYPKIRLNLYLPLYGRAGQFGRGHLYHVQSNPGVCFMLYYALVFLVISIIAGILGFWGIAGAAASIAKILFVLFLVLFIVALVVGRSAV